MLEEVDLSLLHPVLNEEEQRNMEVVRDFLDRNGLGEYYDKLLEFGVRQLKDMMDIDLLNDGDLRSDIGMIEDHVKVFRDCVNSKKETDSVEEFAEVDVFVTRPGPLGVRLRYHRLLETPYIALWEDSNHPNPGPLLSAIHKIHKNSSMVPEPGDALVAVNGESVVGLPLEGAVDIIRGSAVKGGDRILRFRRTSSYEREHVDGKQTMQPILTSTNENLWKSGLTRYDAFDQALGKTDGVVEDRAVRQLAAGGCPEETGIRGIVWRYLLDQLPEKRADWVTHLERERNLYTEFSRDLFKDKGGTDGLQAAASTIQSMQVDKMYEPPPKPLHVEEVEEKTQSENQSEIQSESGMKIGEAGDESEAKGSGQVQSLVEVAIEDDVTDVSEEASKTAVIRESTLKTDGEAESDASLAESSAKLSATAEDKVKKRQVEDEELDEDEFLLYEISKDVVRTHPDLQFFLDVKHGPARYESIKRVLFVYAKLNPGVKYVQGMNELLGALFYVLAAQSPTESESEEMAEMFHPDTAEADAFNCFTVLMGELRDVFVEDLDDSSTGIKGRMAGIDTLLQHHDVKLHSVLVGLGVDPTFYTLRWITTLLSREFDLPDTLRLWDAFLSQAGMRNREIWLAYFCVSMIIGIRDELLVADFGGAINALQSYPPTAPSIEDLLETANNLRKLDAEGGSGGGKTMFAWPTRPLSESLPSMNSEMAERWSNAARSSAVAMAAKATSSGAMMSSARSWWSKRSASDTVTVNDTALNSGLSRSMSENTVATAIAPSQGPATQSDADSATTGIDPLSSKSIDSDSDEFEDEEIPLKR